MGVTDPAETYFKQGLWAWDANAGAWVQLEVDLSGYLKVTGLTLAPGAATAAHQVTQNTALQLIDDLYNALHSVHLDELDVDVQASVLPTGAATSAHQVTQNTALQLIDDLRTALHTVGTDELDVVIDGQTNDVEIVQQAPADLTAALHGYISAAWQKLPMLWGYSAGWREKVAVEDATAGNNTLSTTPVPAGELQVVQAVSVKNITSAPTSIRLFVGDATVQPTLFYQGTPAAGLDAYWSGEAVMKEGDGLKATLAGCTLNDNLVMHAWGYRVDIDL